MLPKVLEDYGPAYIRLGRQPVAEIYDEKYEFHIGKGSILMDGDDVGIIATGKPCKQCVFVPRKDYKKKESLFAL